MCTMASSCVVSSRFIRFTCPRRCGVGGSEASGATSCKTQDITLWLETMVGKRSDPDQWYRYITCIWWVKRGSLGPGHYYQQFWSEPSDNPAPSIPHSCALRGDLAGAGRCLADGWLQRSAPTGEAPGGSISKPTKLDLYILVVFWVLTWKLMQYDHMNTIFVVSICVPALSSAPCLSSTRVASSDIRSGSTTSDCFHILLGSSNHGV